MDDDQLIAKLKEKLTVSGGPFDEGKKDHRNALGTGSTADWLTNPDVVYVEPESPSKKYKGKVFVHFFGRERRKDYKLNMALPQNLWVKGSNISRMEAFGFFAFPR